jgi:hypothetical protein
VTSREIDATPTIRPPPSVIGDNVSATMIVTPSLRRRCTSYWSMRSPPAMRAISVVSISCQPGGNSSEACSPSTSVAW